MRADILLVRHAQPVLPRPGGPDDHHRGLTAAGRAQAEHLVAELSEPAPALIVSSPYLRAVQTVQPLARATGLTVHTHPHLREWDSGLQVTPDYARWYAESWADPRRARPGGESLEHLSDRATAILTTLARDQPGRTVVVGSHGTFIARALAGFGVAAVDWSFCRAMPMPAVYRVRIVGSQARASGPGL